MVHEVRNDWSVDDWSIVNKHLANQLVRRLQLLNFSRTHKIITLFYKNLSNDFLK